jgi:hypothetical protein
LFPDDVVFRRIKYATNPGRFESMTKRAILLYLGEGDVPVDLVLYKVTFFYTDSHGDKVSIKSDSDIFSAAKQFTEGGLKVFANVQKRQDKLQAPSNEASTSRGSIAQALTHQSTDSVADEVDIVSKGNAEPSFASDFSAAVLGKTLDWIAQTLDDTAITAAIPTYGYRLHSCWPLGVRG